MKLKNFDQLLNCCNEFSENHESYGFCEFDIQIKVCGDRSYSIELEFPVIDSVPIYIIPDANLPISKWIESSIDWMDEPGKQSIINWIVENAEIFGIQVSKCDETAHYRCLG